MYVSSRSGYTFKICFHNANGMQEQGYCNCCGLSVRRIFEPHDIRRPYYMPFIIQHVFHLIIIHRSTSRILITVYSFSVSTKTLGISLKWVLEKIKKKKKNNLYQQPTMTTTYIKEIQFPNCVCISINIFILYTIRVQKLIGGSYTFHTSSI